MNEYLIIGLIIFALVIKGVVRTSHRNAIVAALMMIFLFPVYLIWAFIELFRSKPEKTTKVVFIEKEGS